MTYRVSQLRPGMCFVDDVFGYWYIVGIHKEDDENYRTITLLVHPASRIPYVTAFVEHKHSNIFSSQVFQRL